MRHTQHILLCNALVPLALVLAAIVLFETDVLPCGVLKGQQTQTEFVAAVTMEIFTIALIPLALKLFKLHAVSARLHACGTEALMRFGLMRLAMLTVPMMANTLLYYLFMNVAFGYLAIILALCLCFVFPTKARCEAEAAGSES